MSLQESRLSNSYPVWERKKLKHLSRIVGGGTPSKDDITYWFEGDVPWVSPKDMKRREIFDTEDYITEQAVKETATRKVPKGTPLVVARSGILKHSLPIAIAGVDVALNQDMKAFLFGKQVRPKFFQYWVEGQSAELLLEWRQLGATVDSIDIYRMMDSMMAVPPVDYQEWAIKLLDIERDIIDRQLDLIGGFSSARTATPNSMLQLLWERRAALITEVVTGKVDYVEESLSQRGKEVFRNLMKHLHQ
jgi:type I restriction enzyme S subunit